MRWRQARPLILQVGKSPVKAIRSTTYVFSLNFNENEKYLTVSQTNVWGIEAVIESPLDRNRFCIFNSEHTKKEEKIISGRIRK